MTTRAADDFAAIRARLGELRQAAALDAEAIDYRERVGAELWNYMARRRAWDRDYDAPPGQVEPAGLSLAGRRSLILTLEPFARRPGLLIYAPHPSPRAPARACEGIGGLKPDPALAAPTVEEPDSERSEFRGLGMRSA